MAKKLTQKDVKILYSKLRTANREVDIQVAWRNLFDSYFIDKNKNEANATDTSPANVDGFIVEGKLAFALRILLEFKDNRNKEEYTLTRAKGRARIAIQCIYYMNRFQHYKDKKTGKSDPIKLPNVIVGADERQAFVLYAPNFYKYLDDNYLLKIGVKPNWKIPPSEAYKSEKAFMDALQEDRNLSVFVYDLGSTKSLKDRTQIIHDLFDEIDKMADFDLNNKGDTFKVKVTESNIAVLFDDFVRITFGNMQKSDKLSPVDLVNIFEELLLGRNKDEYYQIPGKNNLLHLPGDKKVKIHGSDMRAFFNHFNKNFSIKEQDRLISISDRLIEDITRRRKGDYWTPTIWANKAIELIDDSLNGKWRTKNGQVINDWKKDCVVWDCASGSKNLTRDYLFNHLYSSTIHQAELDLSTSYNSFPKSNLAFQYDFLNDDIEALSVYDNFDIHSLSKKDIIQLKKELKMPDNLFDDLLKNKPIVFYINPPFGTANNRAFTKQKNKNNMAATAVNGMMKSNSLGSASQQLYTQFFYRIIEIIREFRLSNVVLASFSPYQFRTGGIYFGKFYNYFLKYLHPFRGFLFSAGEFSNVNKDWGITFSLYSNENSFKVSEKIDIDTFLNGHIQKIGNKTIKLVNPDDSLSYWIKINQNLGEKIPKENYSEVTSAIKVVPSGSTNYYSNSIGYMYYIGNDVEHSDTAVTLFSTCFKSGHGINVTKSNLLKAIVGFALRRSATYSWFNGKDQFYMDNYNKNTILNNRTFVIDCLLMSIMHYRASYQSSLGELALTPEQPEIINNWFFLPVSIMRNIYGNARVSDNYRQYFADEYNRTVMSHDTPIVKLLEDAGARFQFKDTSLNTDQYKEVIVLFQKNNFYSKEAKRMLVLLVKLFNETWPMREDAIINHPDWSTERYDAGFNQMYRMINEDGPKNNWNIQYFEAFNELRNSIHNYGQKMDIIPEDA